MDRLEDGRAHERPGGHAQERQRADDAEGPRPGRPLEQVRGGGRGDRDDRAAAHGLDQAGRDELVERLGHPGQERAEREDREGRQEAGGERPTGR